MTRATKQRPNTENAQSPRRRRKGLIILGSSAAVLATLWIVYWYGANQIGAAALDRISAAANARGYAAECRNLASGGFPLSLNLSCSHASVTPSPSSDGLMAAVEGFSASAPLYRPGRIEWVAAGPLALSAPANALNLTATWKTAETTLDAGLDGLAGFTTQIVDLVVEPPPEPSPNPFDRLSLSSADLSVIPGVGTDYRVSATARAVAVETGSGGDLPSIDLDAELTAIEFGDSLGVDPRQALRDWLATSGTLRIDELRIATDTVTTAYSGTLSLSPTGTISGNLDVTISGIEALPDLVETFRPNSREQVARIVAAVVAFTKPVETPTGPAREMTLLMRDGIVSIGILPIGVIPPIIF